MAVRIHERQDGRDAGRRADAGDGGAIPCAFVAFVALYLVLHAAFWLGRVILP